MDSDIVLPNQQMIIGFVSSKERSETLENGFRRSFGRYCEVF